MELAGLMEGYGESALQTDGGQENCEIYKEPRVAF